ncbi:hypothetical protein TNIN_298111 [Trichonephila inaurata madagascariensis]|uniref:Uncharacterized protein n=1 Tax=Trichonephila inaurata madagascariensis TaxID=2747483 RepID=A0A8X6WMV4_9ARAC|nr:hypothetical protein TNIN_298111 [Trichonephila inaurata madagascariensis]
MSLPVTELKLSKQLSPHDNKRQESIDLHSSVSTRRLDPNSKGSRDLVSSAQTTNFLSARAFELWKKQKKVFSIACCYKNNFNVEDHDNNPSNIENTFKTNNANK